MPYDGSFKNIQVMMRSHGVIVTIINDLMYSIWFEISLGYKDAGITE